MICRELRPSASGLILLTVSWAIERCLIPALKKTYIANFHASTTLPRAITPLTLVVSVFVTHLSAKELLYRFYRPCVSGDTCSKLNKQIKLIMPNCTALILSVTRNLLFIALAFGTIAGPRATGRALATHNAELIGDAEFDVASVKQFKRGTKSENRGISFSHGSLVMQQQTFAECVAWAYSIKNSDQIKLPARWDSEEFDISAQTSESTTQEQVKLMLQGLLTERFKLALRHATELRQVYALTLAKHGLRLREVKRQSINGGRLNLEHGVFKEQMTTDMAHLAAVLPMFLDRPVLDRTGLTGIYEVTLTVEMETQVRLPDAGETFAGFGMTPGIFRAVEELGLKLVPQKGAIDVLIIDHVEKPSAN